MNPNIPKLAITAGEPAGIGPDIILMAAQRQWPAQLVCIADRDLLAARASRLGLDIELKPYTTNEPATAHQPGQLSVVHVPLCVESAPGHPTADNARYVLATLAWATDAVLGGDMQAIVTGPVQKSTIADAGIPFSGHTEFFAEATGTDKVVMMLATGSLRVALATTHLPLRAVADAITPESLTQTLEILIGALRTQFGISQPTVAVLGLNPHAGEGGHLGREEIDVISPVCEALRQQGHDIRGPLPADTAFNPDMLAACDAYLAMFHDQGLPVLKYTGFGEAVNITLGMPIIRTSVDHGTALDLAGSGTAQPDSLYAAIEQAITLANASRGRR